MIAVLKQLFGYDGWANREIIQSFEAAENLTAKPLKLLGHIVAAEVLWYERIQGQKQSMPVWPELTLEQYKAEAEHMAWLWREYLQQGDAVLTKAVSYKNSQGQSWNSSVQDILLHVITHSSYHRGQIAAEMRAAGYTPAYTDFIHAVRNKLIE